MSHSPNSHPPRHSRQPRPCCHLGPPQTRGRARRHASKRAARPRQLAGDLARALEFFDEAKREVTHQVALVKLVEQHGTDAGQFGVILQTAQQHALGDELDFRLRAGVIFEPHLIAHTLAKRGVAFPGDAAGERAGGDAPGLHDDHAAFTAKDVVEDHLRHLRGLAGAGRRTENEAVLNRQRVGDFRVDVPDGERLAKRLGHGVGD